MLVIRDGYVVTMNDSMDVFEGGAVAVEGGRIADVGPARDLERKYPDAEFISAKGGAVLPGLVSAHTHLFQSLFRGIGDGLPLADWVGKCIFPLCRNLGRDETYSASMVSILEMLKTGTTTFVDSHYITRDKECYDAIAQAVSETGVRGVIGRSTVNCAPAPEDFWETPAVAERESIRVIETYHNTCEGRLKVRVEPLNESSVTLDMVKTLAEVARGYGVGFDMHIAETSSRVADSRARYGLTSVQLLDSLGILGPDTLLAHCVWVDNRDIALLAASDTKVAHNPVSNQYLADGVAPVPKMLRAGITVAAAPDGPSSNNCLDMFQTMKAAAILHRAFELDSAAIDSATALRMGTIDAARAVGMEEEIGSIEPGKKADLIVVDLSRPEMVPSLSTFTNLLYCATGSAVETVMVDGRFVVKDRAMLTMDEPRVIEQANSVARELVEKADLWGLVNPRSVNIIK
ncbi:MAG TPA: amidohydrolase [Bacillota bacterium]|nr:amidohydrolase [Bacillota bacterium]HNU93319.1 amidohydrolase [Bacillota bacterium]HNY67439.1 amidohydrolase [Bacillota bacterium]